MTDEGKQHNPNIEIDEVNLQAAIEIASEINQQEGVTWGQYVHTTIDLFEATQDRPNPDIDVQLDRLRAILPDLKVAERLEHKDLYEFQRASMLAIKRALFFRRLSFDV
jgi:hypothetical protein